MDRILIVWMMICFPVLFAQAQNSAIPHLEKHGTATQLVVDGKPFLMLAVNCTIPAHPAWNTCGRYGPVWRQCHSIPCSRRYPGN